MMVQGHTLDDAEGVGHLRGPGVDRGQEHEEVVGRRVGHELQVVGLGPGGPETEPLEHSEIHPLK